MKELIDASPTFVARDKDGNEVPMDEYLKFASLSPWVPCPDPVARKMLDISQIGPEDVSGLFCNIVLYLDIVVLIL